MATVFIGVPTFNRPRFVRDTLASLISQTLSDWRAVVSDNASNPDAASEVRSLVDGLNDPRISYVLQPRNGGEFGQGRFFFGEAGAEPFFVILHDDDVLGPGYLKQAVSALLEHPSASLYLSDPVVIDENGDEQTELTTWYRRFHGRDGVPEGSVPVMDHVLHDGFFPISGTCFRTNSLREAGFVDSDLEGNYPFELNVLLRLGERGAAAWYCPRPQVAFRMHADALRHKDRLMENPGIVKTMITLLERRRFSGPLERRRRAVLGRLHRARAMMALKSGDIPTSREAVGAALSAAWTSKRTLFAASAIYTFPVFFRRFIPETAAIACPPKRSTAAATG
jgi:hypothetical protein